MTKKVLCSLALMVALISILSLQAAAQDSRSVTPVPAVSDRILEQPSPGKWIAPLLVPRTVPDQPSYCNPCLFYQGDINPSAANANGFANENTQPSIGLSATTYAAVHVPAAEKWEVTGLATNNLSNNGGVLDPKQATWSISKGLSSGNPGTTIASGTASATATATGRSSASP